MQAPTKTESSAASPSKARAAKSGPASIAASHKRPRGTCEKGHDLEHHLDERVTNILYRFCRICDASYGEYQLPVKEPFPLDIKPIELPACFECGADAMPWDIIYCGDCDQGYCDGCEGEHTGPCTTCPTGRYCIESRGDYDENRKLCPDCT